MEANTMIPEFERQVEDMNSGGESPVHFRDRDQWFVVRISLNTRGDRKINGGALTFIGPMPRAISSSLLPAIRLERAAG
jgi:hypothetical protein